MKARRGMSLENLPNHWGFWQNILNVCDLLIQMWAPTSQGRQPLQVSSHTRPRDSSCLLLPLQVNFPFQLQGSYSRETENRGDKFCSKQLRKKGIRDSHPHVPGTEVAPAPSSHFQGDYRPFLKTQAYIDGKKSPGVQKFIVSPYPKYSD